MIGGYEILRKEVGGPKVLYSLERKLLQMLYDGIFDSR